MMRVRRVMHICANSAAHHIPRRSTTSVPQDPSTWPKNYSGPEIKHLLESHLKDPSTRKWPNFDLIAVESVTGRVQYPSYYCDPPTAYATWIRETARHFEIPSTAENVEPLIIIDTCELLAAEEHKSLVHTCSRKPYTLLEAFCRSVPAPYSIFVIGCKTILNVDHLLLTMANMRRVRPLAPLSNDAFIKSLAESWGAKSDDELIKLQYHWAGGTPRLLRQSGFWSERSKSDTVGSASKYSRCLEAHAAIARSQYPLHTQLLPFAYSCMLASSTKATVRSDEIIPLSPAWNIIGHQHTFNDAMFESIGLHDSSTNRFMVPPITLRDELMTELRHEVPILPSQLDPFIDTDFIAHYPLQLNEDRGRIFAKTFVFAVYARYLLAHWKDTKTSWVSLEKVFEGAVRPDQVPLLERWDVNLAGGLAISARTLEQRSLTYSAHDAYIWCRDKRGNKMQMRLRREVDVASRSSRSFVLTLCRDGAGGVNGLDDVVINADAMSSACGMISL